MTGTVISTTELPTQDGRTLHVYDTGKPTSGEPLAVFWHHGTPNIGAPPEPLFAAAERLGIRFIGYDRPGYGGSTAHAGRDIASAAADVLSIADALKLERFAVMGHSGGGPHALACAALVPERVLGAVSIAGLAPYGAQNLDWFEGINPSGKAELRAALSGREALAACLEAGEFDPEMFTPADHAALGGSWSWLHSVVGPATAAGPGGMIDDDLAYVRQWGFDPAQIEPPVLLMHGQQDRVVPSSHSQWLSRHCPSAELRLFPDDGHLSVLHSAEAALEWLRQQAG